MKGLSIPAFRFATNASTDATRFNDSIIDAAGGRTDALLYLAPVYSSVYLDRKPKVVCRNRMLPDSSEAIDTV